MLMTMAFYLFLLLYTYVPLSDGYKDKFNVLSYPYV